MKLYNQNQNVVKFSYLVTTVELTTFSPREKHFSTCVHKTIFFLALPFLRFKGIFDQLLIFHSLNPHFIKFLNRRGTGKSLSEALIFAYDHRLFIELQVQCMKIPSSKLGRTYCVQKLFLTFRTIFVHNMFSPCSAKRRASDKDLPLQSWKRVKWSISDNWWFR